jgi:hypothetical protein
MKARTLALLLAAMALSTALTGCKPPVNLNDLPVSHWADPKTIGADGNGFADACSVASAKAIVKAGLPFPNYGTKDELAADGKTVNKRITTVDAWLGGVRLVLPAEIAATGGYPTHNPNRYNGLQGSLPNFYPKGEPAKAKDGMGAMVDVKFICSMEPSYVNYKSAQSNEEAIHRVKAAYEKSLMDNPEFSGTVTVNIREDLGMTEVLLDRNHKATNGRLWEASYWPVNRELKDATGMVSGITCRTRNDPEPIKRYRGVGHRCSVGIGISPNAHASVAIYVSHLDQMPAIFDQVQQVIINAKKAGE